MSELYTIQKQTLTDIADALRGKYGEIKRCVANVHGAIQNTPNATNHSTFGNYTGGQKQEVRQVTFNGAKYIKVVITCKSASTAAQILIAPGNYTYDNFPVSGETTINIDKECEMRELTFENTDTVSFYLTFSRYVGGQVGFYADVIGFDENDHSIQESFTNEIEIELDLKNKYKTSAVADSINNLSVIPSEAFAISGSCENYFVNNHWNWFVEEFGDKITTKDIYPAIKMFADSTSLTKIPFDLNFNELLTPDCNDMFYNCKKLTHIGKISNMKPSDMRQLFYGCQMLRNLPEFENLNLTKLQTDTGAYAGKIFYQCRSLRSIPESLLKEIYGVQKTSTYLHLSGMFASCEALDEIVGLSPRTGVVTTNMFGTSTNSTFYCCSRIKDLIFDKDTNGAPYEVSWSNQIIDLTQFVGYLMVDNLSTYNSGITADKQVTDDATYQALKNDPDWYTTDVAYSRYNHDSAVRTIGSLPKTTPGQGNAIKFKGASGSATDGGAISNLTEEEIAVATAKGWTVQIV